MLVTTFGETVKRLVKITILTFILSSIAFLDYSYAFPDTDAKIRKHLVVGGINANPLMFPRTVGLVTEQYRIFCTGSLIGPDLVMTAAHCVTSMISEKFYIMYNCKTPSNCRNFVTASSLSIHPKYNRKYLSNDIAIVLLQRPINFNTNINLLDPKHYNIVLIPGKKVIIAGYGRTSDYGGAGILRYGITSITKVKDSEITLGTTNINDTNVCYGDSGSGFYVYHNNKKYIVGSASRLIFKDKSNNIACGGGSVYTLDGLYFNWISKEYLRMLIQKLPSNNYHITYPNNRCSIGYDNKNKNFSILFMMLFCIVVRKKKVMKTY